MSSFKTIVESMRWRKISVFESEAWNVPHKNWHDKKKVYFQVYKHILSSLNVHTDVCFILGFYFRNLGGNTLK